MDEQSVGSHDGRWRFFSRNLEGGQEVPHPAYITSVLPRFRDEKARLRPALCTGAVLPPHISLLRSSHLFPTRAPALCTYRTGYHLQPNPPCPGASYFAPPEPRGERLRRAGARKGKAGVCARPSGATNAPWPVVGSACGCGGPHDGGGCEWLCDMGRVGA